MFEAADPKFNHFMSEIRTNFKSSEAVTIFSKRNTLKLISIDDVTVIIKSFKTPHLLNQIIYRYFRSSKAKRSYQNARLLIAEGIVTPTPIGYAEYYQGPFLKDSYYVCEHYPHDFEIRAVLKDKSFPDRNTIIKQFIEFSYNLHEKSVLHIDYSPGNILVSTKDGRYNFSLVDVNRLRFKHLSVKERMANLSKLTFDEEDNNLFVEYYAEYSGTDSKTLRSHLQLSLVKQKKYLNKKSFLKSLKTLCDKPS